MHILYVTCGVKGQVWNFTLSKMCQTKERFLTIQQTRKLVAEKNPTIKRKRTDLQYFLWQRSHKKAGHCDLCSQIFVQ